MCCKGETLTVAAVAAGVLLDKPIWSLRRICQYYGEDKDGNALQAEWAKAPTDQDVKQGRGNSW